MMVINRGGLRFIAVDGVFDTEVYSDIGLLYTDSKHATPLSPEAVKSAQAELEEVAKNIGTVIGGKPAKGSAEEVKL